MNQQHLQACGDEHDLALWLTPEAIREAFDGDETNPTQGLSDDQLREIGYEILDGLYEEYRRLLDDALAEQIGRVVIDQEVQGA